MYSPQLCIAGHLPYYAVIFTSLRTTGDNGYDATATHIMQIAMQQPGFLGVDHARAIDGLGITVSYWKDEVAIRQWKDHAEHLVAQRRGCEKWYQVFEVRVAKVERAYGFRSENERRSVDGTK